VSAVPQLTRSDAWILAALCDGPEEAETVRQLLVDADWLNTAVLSFDELSFGMPRLRARGLANVTVGP